MVTSPETNTCKAETSDPRHIMWRFSGHPVFRRRNLLFSAGSWTQFLQGRILALDLATPMIHAHSNRSKQALRTGVAAAAVLALIPPVLVVDPDLPLRNRRAISRPVVDGRGHREVSFGNMGAPRSPAIPQRAPDDAGAADSCSLGGAFRLEHEDRDGRGRRVRRRDPVRVRSRLDGSVRAIEPARLSLVGAPRVNGRILTQSMGKLVVGHPVI